MFATEFIKGISRKVTDVMTRDVVAVEVTPGVRAVNDNLITRLAGAGY